MPQVVPIDDNAVLSVRQPIISRDQRRQIGKSLRHDVPRSSLGRWDPPDDRPDPVEIINRTHASRHPGLIELRIERMLASPYGFLRGTPDICARDCAMSAATGILAIICGDAHLGNFGFYRSAEGELVLDMNDFDEAHPGYWEWDVRRLTASVWVAGRDNSLSESQCADAVHACVNAYRDELALLAEMPLFQRSMNRVDIDRLQDTVSEPSLRDEVERAANKARTRTSDRALPKFTDIDDGDRYIVDDPPVTVRLSPERRDEVAAAIDSYLDTLPLQWRRVVGSYRVVDVAHKVVGVGSVGLHAYIALLNGSAPDDYLFLQLKEARRSVVAEWVHGKKARHPHQGQRVVEYQQSLQTASDPLLGWTSLAVDSSNPLEYPTMNLYVRQYRNMKGAVVLEDLDTDALIDYARVLGLLLAKCHARTSGASLISGYIGKSDAVADAFVKFARKYADQIEDDFERFTAAHRAGELAPFAL